MCRAVITPEGDEFYTIGELKRYVGLETWRKVFSAVDDDILASDDCFCHIILEGALEDMDVTNLVIQD